MRRIFWDAPLLIYLVDGNEEYVERVRYLLAQCLDRGDKLITSWVALGEVLAGAGKRADSPTAGEIRAEMDGLGFEYVDFTEGCVEQFRLLRANMTVRSADAIHLACAGFVGIDLFLTYDLHLTGLHVPGIKFIEDFKTSLLR